MDSLNNSKNLKLYLKSQHDKYIRHLIKIGVKLAKTGNFNEEIFVEQFIPNKDLIIKQIKEQVANDIENSKDCGQICIDSYLFDKLRKELDDFRKDLEDVRKNTNPYNKEDLKQSNETMETASNSGSINEKLSSNDELRTNNNYARKNIRHNNDFEDDSLFVTEELVPGQLSRIIVRKSNVSTIRTNVKNPDFDESILEDISIYRSNIN